MSGHLIGFDGEIRKYHHSNIVKPFLSRAMDGDVYKECYGSLSLQKLIKKKATGADLSGYFR